MKLITTILLSLLSLSSFSQVNKVEFSGPVDLPEFGWNKVLLMKNGNTVLFHFELRKSILVKVFDTNRKEIASERTLTKVTDVKTFDRTMIQGITEVNGEAVVFLTQDVENKTTLMRLRFNAHTGVLISEDIVHQSESFKKATEAYLLKNAKEHNYSVFYFKDPDVNPKIDMRLVKYNVNHSVEKELPVELIKGEYDYMKVAGAGIDERGGIQITILYSQIVKFPDIINREIVIYYLAPGTERFVAKKIAVPQGLYPAITHYTYNPFTSSLNLLMKSVRINDIKNIDYSKLKQVFYPPVLMVTKDDMSTFASALLNYKKANEYLKAHTDTTHSYYGDVGYMYTNQRGLTTVIAESHDWENGMNGNLAITHHNDDGEELWATLIPKSHFNREEKGPYVFGREVNAGLSDYRAVFTKNNTYIFFNDLNKQLATISLPPDSTYAYSNTNGLFYKLDRKRELSNGYLFGNPTGDESKVAYMGSCDFDEEKTIYSSVIMHREGDKKTCKIAWCHLEP